ncbi:MAG: hypothetical protein ACREJC_18760, partial [Tepidisphaeraceae bacterium]
MGRRSTSRAAMGLPPLRKYWQWINQYERLAGAIERQRRKAHDKGRRKCRCTAYPWPHRPGGGLCRWPEAPLEQWQRGDCEHRP